MPPPPATPTAPAPVGPAACGGGARRGPAPYDKPRRTAGRGGGGRGRDVHGAGGMPRRRGGADGGRGGARTACRGPAALAAQMVPKGSVAVAGLSLTLVEVGRDSFSVALIPHTLDVTTLGSRRPGDAVNLEPDVLAKYAQKAVQAYLQPPTATTP